MVDENWQNKNLGNLPPNGSSLGTGEGEVPLSAPPQPNIETRTMDSDLKSLAESGGVSPRPYVPPPPVPTQEKATSPAPENKETFAPPTADLGEPLKSAVMPIGATPAKKSNKGLLVAILTFIIIVGLGAVGYFIVYPKFFGSETTELPPAENVPPPAENLPPAIQEQPAIKKPEPPPSPPPSPTTINSHATFFKTAADLATEVELASPTGRFNLTDLKQTLALAALEVPPFTELVIKDSAGQLPSFYEIARLFAPTTFNETVLQSFEGDFTYFVYINDAGAWPGFIAKTKTAPNQTVFDAVAKLETNGEAANFFFTDPGAPSTWKSGQVNKRPARYLSFSKNGSSLSYTWFDNYLLVSTNYAGAQEAAKRLGY
jgi:hypothetical protein